MGNLEGLDPPASSRPAAWHKPVGIAKRNAAEEAPGSAARRSWVLRSVREDVAEEARTRGFAAPAFTECALDER
jgi:hypothetical protein